MRKAFVLVVCLMLLAAMTSMAEEPFIKLGDYNENVIKLHQKLTELGLYTLRAESPYGSDSVDAVKIVQEVIGREATGVVSQNELEEIMSLEPSDELKADLVNAVAQSSIIENLLTDAQLFNEAEKTDSGYVFTTSLEDNRFSYTVWQVYGPEGYLGNIDTGKEGLTEGDYVFPYESGEYTIVFKGNTNLKDVGIKTTLHLEKDVIYHYSSTVDSLEPQRVVVSDVSFGIKK